MYTSVHECLFIEACLLLNQIKGSTESRDSYHLLINDLNKGYHTLFYR